MEIKFDSNKELNDLLKHSRLKEFSVSIDLDANKFQIRERGEKIKTVGGFDAVKDYLNNSVLKPYQEKYHDKIYDAHNDLRIVAKQDIPEFGVKAGDVGGKIDASSVVDKNSWVSYDSTVFTNHAVEDYIFEKPTEVLNGSLVSGKSEVEGSVLTNVKIFDNSKVYESELKNSGVSNANVKINEGKEDEYWPEKDTGLIIMNESTLIMYDSTNDFVVLTKVSSTDHTITYVDDEGGESMTWTITKNEKKEIIMECEIENYNSWDSCNSDVHWTLKMNKL